MGDLQKKKAWYHIQWFSPDDSPEERKVIWKLDLLIVPYAILAYWVKNLDAAGNLNAAYVGGLKEELGFYGNELVQLQTLYTVGSVVGALPFVFFATYIPMHWAIPAMDILWGIVTLLQYRAASYTEMAVYRFLVGWFEAAFFPAMHYVFGSWYRGHEIARRGGMFYLGLMLGALTVSLITSATTATLNGHSGLSGWRWMYIICAVITLPVGILGFFVLPGSIDQPNRWALNQHDIDVSRARLERAGHQPHGKFKFSDTKKILTKPHFWLIVWVDILFWNSGIHSSNGVFVLWLKSLNRYSTSRVNELGALAPGMGLLYVLLANFSSDLFLGPAWAITITHIWNIIGLIILTIWNVPEPAKWVGYSTIYAAYGMSSVLHGWINAQLKGSPGERAFTLVLMSMIAQSTTAWTPLLVLQTVESPRFPKAFPFILACSVVLIASVWLLKAYVDRLEKQKGFSPPTAADSPETASIAVEESGSGKNASSTGAYLVPTTA